MSIERFLHKLKNREYLMLGIFIIVFGLLAVVLGIFQKTVSLEKDLFVTRDSREGYSQLWLKAGDTVKQEFFLEGHAYKGFLMQTAKTEDAEGEVLINIIEGKTDAAVYKKIFQITEIGEERIEVKFDSPMNRTGRYTIEISVRNLQKETGFAVLASGQRYGGLMWNGYLKDYSLCLTNHCSYSFSDFGMILVGYILLCWGIFYFSFRRKYKKNKGFCIVAEVVFWAVIVCAFWGVWGFSQTRIVKGALQKTEAYSVMSGSGSSVYDLKDGETLFQNFYNIIYKMNGLRFSVQSGSQNPLEGDLAVMLVQNSTQSVLYDKRIPLHTCIGGSVDIDFREEEGEPYKTSYTLAVTYLAANEKAKTAGLVCTGVTDDFAQMTVNGEVVESNIFLEETTDHHPYFTSYFRFVFICLSLAVIFYIFFLRYRKVSFYSAFACSMLLMGIAYSAVFLPYSVEDEHAHYGLAYDVSNNWLGTGSGYDEYDGETRDYTQMMRRDDAQLYLSSDINLDRGEYIWTQLGGKVLSNEMEECISKYVILITKIFYFPSALGITVARLLSFNTYTLIYMGRIFNLLFMVFILYMAMRLCPEGKEMIGAAAFLPISILQLMSYSYDGMIMCTIVFYTAYIFYINRKKENIQIKDILVIMMLIFFITTMKGSAYFSICFLCLLIGKEKFKSKHGFLSFRIGSFLFILVSFFGVYLCFMAQKAVQTNIPVKGMLLNQYSIMYLLQRPERLLDVLVNTVSFQSSASAMQLFGLRLTEYYTMPDILLYFTIFCVFVIVRRCQMSLKKKEGILIGSAVLLGFCCVAAGCVSMTLASLPAIVIRGRYLLPLLFGTCVVFSGKSKKRRPDTWLLCLVVVSALVLLHSLHVLYGNGAKSFSYFY